MRTLLRHRGIFAVVVCVLLALVVIAPCTACASETQSSATWNRLWGATALDTMQHIVGVGDSSSYGNVFDDNRGGTVVIATKATYLDALAASGLAGKLDAPVLLTDGSELSIQTRAELSRLAPDRIIICGGTAAVSTTAESEIQSYTKTDVVRYAGATASQTAVEIYRLGLKGSGCSKTAFIATRNSYKDALSISPYCYANRCPVFLTESDTRLSSQTLDAIADGGFDEVYILGGTASVSEDVPTQLQESDVKYAGRLCGATGCATSEAIAEWETDASRGTAKLSVDKLGVTTANNYRDALCGSALCGHNRSVLLLVTNTDHAVIEGIINRNRSSIQTGYLFGGTASISETLAEAIEGLTPYEAHGALHVSGTNIVDKDGDIFQIRGVSTHGLAWYPAYVNEAAFATWRSWGANTVRLALYTQEYGGYCVSGTNQQQLLSTLYGGVDAATAQGMYAIIDWHILSDGDPRTNEASAKEFFATVSAKYADHGNVLYEICNEPNGSVSWSDIRQYAEDIIPIIRANDPDAIIIVGTPTWSQDVDTVAASPLEDKNTVYALHFYAATHGANLRAKAKTAISAGIPLLVSEFGACEASGNGTVDATSANAWISFLGENGIGYVCWNLSNKSESSSLIASSCSKTSGWTDDELSAEGQWYKGVLGQGGTASQSGGGSGGSTTGGSTSGTSANLKVTCTVAGSWSDGNRCYTKYTLNATNTGSASVSSWKARITFADTVTLSQSWCTDSCIAGGNVLDVTPASYAQTIASGSTDSQVGFIVSCSQEPVVQSVEVVA